MANVGVNFATPEKRGDGKTSVPAGVETQTMMCGGECGWNSASGGERCEGVWNSAM